MQSTPYLLGLLGVKQTQTVKSEIKKVVSFLMLPYTAKIVAKERPLFGLFSGFTEPSCIAEVVIEFLGF